jgi:hypothetical protein
MTAHAGESRAEQEGDAKPEGKREDIGDWFCLAVSRTQAQNGNQTAESKNETYARESQCGATL